MDEDDYEEDEEERQTWVEALTQELADDDALEEDPDYEVGGCWLLRTRSQGLDTQWCLLFTSEGGKIFQFARQTCIPVM